MHQQRLLVRYLRRLASTARNLSSCLESGTSRKFIIKKRFAAVVQRPVAPQRFVEQVLGLRPGALQGFVEQVLDATGLRPDALQRFLEQVFAAIGLRPGALQRFVKQVFAAIGLKPGAYHRFVEPGACCYWAKARCLS